jgi:hypothetical protein
VFGWFAIDQLRVTKEKKDIAVFDRIQDSLSHSLSQVWNKTTISVFCQLKEREREK